MYPNFSRVLSMKFLKKRFEMKFKKEKLKPVTFKIHPEILEQIDKYIENIIFRSRGHIINIALAEWIDKKKNRN